MGASLRQPLPVKSRPEAEGSKNLHIEPMRQLPSGSMVSSPLEPLTQRRHESVGVLFVVEDMGRKAHARQPRCNMNALLRQPLDQPGRQAAGKAEAQDMGGAKARLHHAQAR